MVVVIGALVVRVVVAVSACACATSGHGLRRCFIYLCSRQILIKHLPEHVGQSLQMGQVHLDFHGLFTEAQKVLHPASIEKNIVVFLAEFGTCTTKHEPTSIDHWTALE